MGRELWDWDSRDGCSSLSSLGHLQEWGVGYFILPVIQSQLIITDGREDIVTGEGVDSAEECCSPFCTYRNYE